MRGRPVFVSWFLANRVGESCASTHLSLDTTPDREKPSAPGLKAPRLQAVPPHQVRPFLRPGFRSRVAPAAGFQLPAPGCPWQNLGGWGVLHDRIRCRPRQPGHEAQLLRGMGSPFLDRTIGPPPLPNRLPDEGSRTRFADTMGSSPWTLTLSGLTTKW